MHPHHHAQTMPDKPACIMAGTGETLRYADLETRANQCAHRLRALGLRRGDVIAVMVDNEPALFPLAWAAQRTGLYLTSISTKSSIPDLANILSDCAARVLVVSDRLAPLAAAAVERLGSVQAFALNDTADLPSWLAGCVGLPGMPVADETPGTEMLYSSGTTGRPKGVKPPLPDGPLDQPTPLVGMGRALYGMGDDMVYLSTSPLYHAAPLRWAMTIHRFGGTVIIMDRFDAETALSLIEKYSVTHSTWVPTHFVRLLRLAPEVRARYDHSSLLAVIHAAAPCPVPVKQAMIDWWGPIIYEYYSGTETCGITALSAQEWLRKPGSVGRAVLGTVKITDDDGNELPAGQVGNVYFADGPRFEYHNDPVKTACAFDHRGWATLGDIGRLDEDGYLFLTDRKNFMIISGGVNIYPQEIENCLIEHPAVADGAVFGLPDLEMGQVVVAVIQPVAENPDEAALAADLSDFLRNRLGGVKVPRIMHFRQTLPREPTGKLLKHELVREYLDQAGGPVER